MMGYFVSIGDMVWDKNPNGNNIVLKKVLGYLVFRYIFYIFASVWQRNYHHLLIAMIDGDNAIGNIIINN